MDIPKFPGWHLLGAFPDGEPDDVGSWLLHHGGEAMLLEVPPGLTPDAVRKGLEELGCTLKLVTASHDHEDHLDLDAWSSFRKEFHPAKFIHPYGLARDTRFTLGGEPVWLVPAPKHSRSDVITVFRGVAMTGDVELGTLDVVYEEVGPPVRRRSMERARWFQLRTGYHVHSVVSAHLNDVRQGVDWPSLFTVE